MNSWIAFGLILGLLFVGSVALNYALYVNNINHFQVQSNLSISSVNRVDNLGLTLSLNATSIIQGQTIQVNITESNILNRANTVDVAHNWPLTLRLGPCGNGAYPIGLAFFKGYYTSSNISTAAPLEINNPTIFCPQFILLVDSYTFQPLSDVASVNSPTSGFILPINYSMAVSGYWTLASEENFILFQPGIYTVAGGDEWGQLVILHFEVT